MLIWILTIVISSLFLLSPVSVGVSVWLPISSMSYVLLYCVCFSTFLSTLTIVLSTFVFSSLFCKIHIRIKTPWWRTIFRVGYIGVIFAISPIFSPLYRLSEMCCIAGLMHSPISLIKARAHRRYLPLISPSVRTRIACSWCVSLASGRWIGYNALGRILTDQSAAKCGRT